MAEGECNYIEPAFEDKNSDVDAWVVRNSTLKNWLGTVGLGVESSPEKHLLL